MALFTVTPATQTTQVNVATGNYTITLNSGVAPGGGYAFDLSSLGGGGTFSPVSPVTMAAGQSTATFTFAHSIAGTYTLRVSAQASLDPQLRFVDVQAVVTSGSPPGPTGFTLTPSSNSAAVGVATPSYFITLTGAGGAPAVAGVGGQAFTLSDAAHGGLFSPSYLVLVPAGQSSVSFTYTNAAAGAYTLTASANGSPYSTNSATAQAIVGGVAMPTQGAVLTNLDGLVFDKGYMYGTIQGHTTDAIGFGALQNVNIAHTFTFSEVSGPESLSPLGVGVKSEELSGSWEYGVILPEQFIMALGGSQSYNAGLDQTTFSKAVNDEPLPFNLHFKSAFASPDLEVYMYNCLAASWNIVRADNRAFAMGSGNFRCYGQTQAQGGVLFTVVRPGNLTNSS